MDDGDKKMILGGVAAIALIVATAVALGWWRAGVQAEVYRRQGAEMSTWEVFMGAKPIHREIEVK